MFLPHLTRNAIYQQPVEPAADEAHGGEQAQQAEGAAGGAGGPRPAGAAASLRSQLARHLLRGAPPATLPAARTLGCCPLPGLRPRRAAALRATGLVVAEFHCSVALRRRLDWTRVNLWPSELPAATTVSLSGRDNLVPVAEVRAILVSAAPYAVREGWRAVHYCRLA
jgi:hypothetical protein